jgi:phenylpyruvate tautomerase
MPLLTIQTNQPLEPDMKTGLLKRASETVSRALGKPEQYVMVNAQSNSDMLFAGSDKPLAYLELKSIGLPEDRTRDLSQALCGLVHEQLGIDTNRIYIEFANADRHMWGWDSRTF